MKKFFKGFLLAFLLITCLHAAASAQTTTVQYELVFNPTTCNYEAHAHVSGSGYTGALKIPGTARFSIVLPAGVSDTQIIPISVSPPSSTWNSVSVYAPIADPAHDFHSFAIGSGGTAYTSFNNGDDILLFTFSFAGQCASGIRLYVNGVDPDSSAEGMNELDFSQSFRILGGGEAELFAGNVSNDPITDEAPIIAMTHSCTATDIMLMANATVPAACRTISGYSWTGPAGFASTDENPVITVTDPVAEAGTYTLVVTDSNGCTSEASIALDGTNCEALEAGPTCGPLYLTNANTPTAGIDPATYVGTIIESDGDVLTPTYVEYIAETCIALYADFEVEVGAEFYAHIVACPASRPEKEEEPKDETEKEIKKD